MDAVNYRGETRVSEGRMKWRRQVTKCQGKGHQRKEKKYEEEDAKELVEVLLQGKAPWGFTLRGGTEHREPLVITKVEEGSIAAAVHLQAGDEMMSVNSVLLSGSRQEAISLVKSSHRTLTMVVRRPKVVDVVSLHIMPSETDVNVARSFLTKILRSSMRKNRFKGKNNPGSRPQSWHSSRLTEESEPAGREATPAPVWKAKHEASRYKESSTLGEQNTECPLTSQYSSVDNMERLEHPSQPYPQSCLSPTKYINSTEPPSGLDRKRDSGFSCFSNGSSPPVHDQRISARKGTSTENIFFKGLQSEGLQQAGRPRYLQSTPGNGGWEEPSFWVSIAGRTSNGPVWQVPERKSQSSPPPPPPLRSDSFAATKVFPYPEGPSCTTKSHGRTMEKINENNDQNAVRAHHEKTLDAKHNFNHLLIKDFLHPNISADHNQLRNKLFSLSSNDVRQSHYTHVSAHQRQYSDESPLYLQTRSAPPTKTQSVESYYRSLQDLPTNVFSHKQIQHATTAMTSAGVISDPESGRHTRHYGAESKHLVQTAELHTRTDIAESQKVEREKSNRVNTNESGFPTSVKGNMKGRFALPQPQTPYTDITACNGHSYLGNGFHFDHQISEHSNRSSSPDDSAKRGEAHTNDMKGHFPTHPSNDHKISLSRQQDPWVPQEDHRISSLKTPLLHSLAQESRSLADRQQAAMTIGVMSSQETVDSTGKTNRRSDRYATTLRKEIQQKRAQLQKSRSAATLTGDAEDEDVEEWRSTETSLTSGVSFSNTYKDHLKEAQARVLQATSFQRRDLEPFGPEVPAVKSHGRVRGRKRFHLAKRTHSFSEPDKMDKIGVEGEPQPESFGERRKVFEPKPTFSRPVLKSSQGTNLNTHHNEAIKLEESPPSAETEEANPSSDPNLLSPGPKQALHEQERLGTFAEYQATWNKQKSAEVKTQGRYHSAENILDADAEEKTICLHARSRSSPSADFYTQNIPTSWRDPQAWQSSYTTGRKTENRLRYQPDHRPPSTPSGTRNEEPVPGLSDHRTKPSAANPSQTILSSGSRSLSPNLDSQHSAQPPQTKGILPPPRPHLGPETTSSSSDFHPGAQADPSALQPLSRSSLDTQHNAAGQGAQASSPHLSRTPVPDMSQEDTESEYVKEQPPTTSSSSSPFSSWTAAQLFLTPDRARSPSPQFTPLRLTDKPPTASVQDDSQPRSENEPKFGEVRKVPVRIVHTESGSDHEAHVCLPHSRETSSAFQPPPHMPSLCATEQPASSLFSSYTHQVTQDLSQESMPELSLAGAQHTEEDAKREELARAIMGKDKSLVEILDQSSRKTTMDLMEGLFPPEEEILEGAHQRRRASASSRLLTSSPRSTDRREEEDTSLSAASLVPSSSYYSTSAPKAELLIKLKDMQGELEEQDSDDELDVDLASKKQELISSLARKLEVLREARQSLQEDVEDNETLGREVEATVQRLCQPNQLDKFRMFVGDLDKVVSLLLSLSGRLARVDNALNSLEEEGSPEEKCTLTEKRKLLMRQHEDAKELKENLDRREQLVYGIMEVHLDAASLDDYRHFVKMKSALIIEQRKLEDKIKLGEEQLKCLLDSLPLEQRPLF